MSRRLHRIWLLPLLFLAGQAGALGLGDIRLSSALNQPLRAEIELLAATTEELTNLTVQMASAETFSRYDLDRPLYLTRLQFEIVKSGRADGNFVRVTSPDPITEPFITFLVEAVWSRGRLLREYTLLLDPPTFAPPPVAQATQAVVAPSRVTPADSGEIQRPAPQQQPPRQAAPQPVQAPVQTPSQPTPTDAAQAEPLQAETPPAAQLPEPEPEAESLDPYNYSSTSGENLLVVRGDTLWGITSRVRPDSRLTFNQTMLAIFEENPEAFEGNINRLRAGATLRIPSADDIFRINRGDAFSEVQRQNDEWSGTPIIPDTTTATEDTFGEPNLTLVPPDEDDLALTDTSTTASPDDLIDDSADDVFVDPTEQRINEIEALIEDQDSLIEIPDNELAALRAELSELRGEEPPEPLPVEDEVDDLLADDADDLAVTDDTTDDIVAEPVDTTVPAVVSRAPEKEGIVDVILGYLGNFWVIIGVALVFAVLVLVWFMRRAAGDDDDSTGTWDSLDEGDMGSETFVGSESLRSLGDNETTILVEEQAQPERDDLMVENLAASGVIEVHETRQPSGPEPLPVASADPLAETGVNKTLEDTFSSETAINLDQSDPVAEADFHMAYGLYDQAADLINGALTAEPHRQDLLAKLCEIYFVWGNRDAFVDAAGRLKAAVGGETNAEWDKIVIMGQQIAGDHEMFSGVSAGAATKAVDLSFEGSEDDAAALDMDLAGEPEDGGSDIIDLGSETGQVMISPESGGDIDFSFEEPDPLEVSATREMSADDETADTPAAEGTVSTPTMEQQFEVLEATGELPQLIEPESPVPASDATAEINLDDLGLDLDSLSDSSFSTGMDDIDDLDDTAQSQTLKIDDLEVTGTSLAADEADALEATGQNEAPNMERTGIQEGIGISKAMATDEDDAGEDTDVGLDTSLLDATGMTQVISEDMAVDTGTDIGATLSDDDKTMVAPSLSDNALADEAATMLAPLDDDSDDGDFDFAKTEALPKDVFSPDMSIDDTGTMESVTGGTDMDLDLDDLTAALKVTEVGDTISQTRDEATVEQPRVNPSDVDLDVGMALDGDESGSTTQALAPDELSGDLHDARTMTEVGTKLDLARAYVDMGDPGGARSILEEVLDEGDQAQKQQAQQLLESLPA